MWVKSHHSNTPPPSFLFFFVVSPLRNFFIESRGHRGGGELDMKLEFFFGFFDA